MKFMFNAGRFFRSAATAAGVGSLFVATGYLEDKRDREMQAEAAKHPNARVEKDKFYIPGVGPYVSYRVAYDKPASDVSPAKEETPPPKP